MMRSGLLSFLFITIAVLAAGCGGVMSLEEAERMRLEANRRAGVGAMPIPSDGYELVGAMLYEDLQRGRPAGKFKWCTRLWRFTKEPGENVITSDAGPDARRNFQAVMATGKLPIGRYYAGDAGNNGVYVSVPAAERTEFARNVEAGQVCLWTEGNPQAITVPNPTTKGAEYTAFHVMVSKWSGALRQVPPGGAGAVPANPGAPQ